MDTATVQQTRAQRRFLPFLTERIAIFNNNVYFVVLGNVACALVIFNIYKQEVSEINLTLWVCGILAGCLLRGGLVFYNRQSTIPDVTYYSLLITTALIIGCFWGLTAYILMPHGDYLDQMLLIIVLIGISASSLQTLQHTMLGNIGFTLVSMLPVTIWAFTQQNAVYTTLGSALLIYIFFNILMAVRNYYFLIEILDLRHRNIESETRFRLAFDHAAIGMAIVSLEGHWMKVNQSLCRLVGYTQDELLKTDFQTITFSEDLDTDLHYVSLLLRNEISNYHMEKRYITKNQNIIWVSLNVSLVRDTDETPLYFIAQIQDIDIRKQAESALKQMAYSDSLTGLPNRKQLEIYFKSLTHQNEQRQNKIAVCFLDLDHFKEINDTLGHEAGDIVLKIVASRIQASLRHTDFVARIGGDEFILLLPNVTSEKQILQITNKLIEEIANTIHINDKYRNITSSIGISLYPDDAQDLTTLIKYADSALYRIKSTTRNNSELYSSVTLTHE